MAPLESNAAVPAHVGGLPLEAVLKHLNLSGADCAWKPLPGGSVPLLSDGRRVLKFFPRGGERFAEAEWAALEYLHGKLPIETPEPQKRLRIDDWSVVCMSLIEGLPARCAWSKFSGEQKASLSRQLGRALHDLPPPTAPALQPPGGTFEAYLAQRVEQFLARADELGNDPGWMRVALDFLQRFCASRPADRPCVLLHTEIMPEHVIVRMRDDQPQLVGLVDFEPAMVGDPHYEFASVGWFWSEGDRAVLDAVLCGYVEGAGLDLAPKVDELMAHSLAHRYFHRERWLARLGPRCEARELDQLAHYVFDNGFSAGTA